MESAKNVLIVEDNKKDALFLEKLVTSFGYNVTSVSKGENALKAAKQTSFCTVLTELHMGGMSGIEITEEFQKIDPSTNVIAITAYSFIEFAVEAMEEGAYGYITKPFNPSEIKIMLEHAVERYELLYSNKDKKDFAEMSVKDGLTGVYNRRFLNTFVSDKIITHERAAEKFALLIVDLDHFKTYNDTNGHLAGDELLKKACDLLKDSLRHGDIVFRYGGDEFIIFLDHTEKKEAMLVAERTRKMMALYAPITASIGVGVFPNDGRELEALISKIDHALYKAKDKGRNKVCSA